MSSRPFIQPARNSERRSADLTQAEISVWNLIRDNKMTCVGATLTGIGLGFGAKYVAAALLIISMALGN